MRRLKKVVGRIERRLWRQFVGERRTLCYGCPSSLSGERDDKIASHTAPEMVFTVWTTVWMASKLLKPKGLAERVGFEPTLEFPLNTLSKRAPSATRPSLRTMGVI